MMSASSVEVVGQRLDGLQSGQVLGQQAENLRVVHFAQDVHFAFGIAGMVGQAAPEFLAEFRPVGGDVIEARIEQFVEQQRVAAKVVGGPRRGADHVGDAAQRHRILLQQRQVGAAAADGFDEVQAARQRRVRVRSKRPGLKVAVAFERGVDVSQRVTEQLCIGIGVLRRRHH